VLLVGPVKKISFGSWAFSFGPYASRPIPLRDIAAGLKRARYDGIELGGFPPQVTLETHGSARQQAELRRLLDAEGLAVSGYAADLAGVNPTVESNQARYLDRWKRLLDLAKGVGAPLIRVDTVAAPGSIPDDQLGAAMDTLAETWRAAADLAAKAGIRVGWEFEPGFAFNRPSEIVEIHEKVRHPNFTLLFDLAHAYMCAVKASRQQGEPETLRGGVGQLLDLCVGRIGGLHVNDSDGTLYNDETSAHLPPGEGSIPFPELTGDLRGLQGLDWVTVDLSFWPGAWEALSTCQTFAGKIFR
jgi:sugar phosphate isomerase/epimerase